MGIRFLIDTYSRMTFQVVNTAGWWFQPLRKIWVRQLRLWHSQYMEKKIKPCSKPPTSYDLIRYSYGFLWHFRLWTLVSSDSPWLFGLLVVTIRPWSPSSGLPKIGAPLGPMRPSLRIPSKRYHNYPMKCPWNLQIPNKAPSFWFLYTFFCYDSSIQMWDVQTPYAINIHKPCYSYCTPVIAC